jgi:hypothetical protein
LFCHQAKSLSESKPLTGKELNNPVIQAFLKISEGFSPDRVVADPDLNTRFLKLCRELHPSEEPRLCNRKLINARKAGLLKGIKSNKRTSFPSEDEYRYASEIAIRHLQRKLDVTLDDIICDPLLVEEFDQIAVSICPGFSVLEYRWAALNLRKSSNLKPELLSHVVRPTGVSFGSVRNLSFSELPSSQGLYLFFGGKQTLYVGEATSLRRRIEKHLDHSDNRELARWFWENGFTDVNLEIHELPNDTSTKVRRALESELINSRHPVFNVRRL